MHKADRMHVTEGAVLGAIKTDVDAAVISIE
jgi:hypothetical protein